MFSSLVTYALALGFVVLLLALLFFAMRYLQVRKSKHVYYDSDVNILKKKQTLNNLESLHQNLGANPEDPYPNFYLAKHHAYYKNTRSEFKHLNECLRKQKNARFEHTDSQLSKTEEHHAYLRFAQLCYDLNKIEAALESFLHAYKCDPQDEYCLASLAFICLGQRGFHSALYFFTQLIENFSNSPKSLSYHIGYIVCLSVLRSDKLILELKKSLSLFPNDRNLMLFQTVTYAVKLENYAAYKTVLKLIKHEEDDFLLYFYYRVAVFICCNMQNYSKALRYAKLYVDEASKMYSLASNRNANLLLIYLAFINNDTLLIKNVLEDLEVSQVNHEDKHFEYFSFLFQEFKRKQLSLEELFSFSKNNSVFYKDFKNCVSGLLPYDFLYTVSSVSQKTIPRFHDIVSMALGKKLEEERSSALEVSEKLQAFSQLSQKQLFDVCQKLYLKLGYRYLSMSSYHSLENQYYILAKEGRKKNKVLVYVSNDPEKMISDIFLREFQDIMQQEAISFGCLLVNAKFTSAARSLLRSQLHIEAISGVRLAQFLDDLI